MFPIYSLKEPNHFWQKFEPNIQNRINQNLSLEGFFSYLTSEANSAFKPLKMNEVKKGFINSKFKFIKTMAYKLYYA